ncbi:GNAT family N-acetyltransferase [Acetonema longum]|uniref:Putative acetyltransferase n=1 Tax=Acetonema longum DSM 6540 TaxID=1009370 RepID=F7NN98_9FIRM|nr:GNAT family N-acetyltransferase [Acetonema longum]EGO62483.1 putative acetyltransferase [Acetonema longum DSM 6540]
MVTIVNIEAADMEQLAALGEELTGKKPHMPQLKIILDKICSDPNYILIGAKSERGQLLGSVMGILCLDIVGQCQPFMVLENLIVRRNSRRQGVAKQLVGYLEDYARDKNCYFIMLTSLAKRAEAHAFYESIGYAKGMVQGFKKYL